LMKLGLDSGISAGAWNKPGSGHVLHGAMMILMGQAEPGVTCWPAPQQWSTRFVSPAVSR
jgi:hypothetical protein